MTSSADFTTQIDHNRDTASDQQAYDQALAQNGRTFHWARHFLGKSHGANAARLYAFCRLLDDLADGDLPDGARRLDTISDDLAALSEGQSRRPADPDMAAFAPFMHAQNLPPLALRHLIDGLLFDQGNVALENEAELITYGYQVAGTVGLMMCPVLSCDDPVAKDFAIDLGIAMQLTNIARDVLEDAKMGRRYLPSEWSDGLSPSTIADGAAHDDPHIIQTIKTAIDRTLTLAEAYYQSGLVGLSFLPRRASFAIGIAAHCYRQIGVQLQRHDLNWHHGRTVTSAATKAVVSLRAVPLIGPRTRPISHDDSLHKALKGYAK